LDHIYIYIYIYIYTYIYIYIPIWLCILHGMGGVGAWGAGGACSFWPRAGHTACAFSIHLGKQKETPSPPQLHTCINILECAILSMDCCFGRSRMLTLDACQCSNHPTFFLNFLKSPTALLMQLLKPSAVLAAVNTFSWMPCWSNSLNQALVGIEPPNFCMACVCK